MKNPQNILFVVEEASVEQDAAVRRAVTLAESAQGRLTLLDVRAKPRLGPLRELLDSGDVESRVLEQEQERVDRLLAPHRDRPRISTAVRFGTPFVEAVRDVVEHGRDLLIKATGDGGAHDFLFGGTDQHLLRKCPCPVWLLHHETAPKYRRIVVAVDVDPWGEQGEDCGLNDEILEWAASIAVSDSAELHVVHAWESITEQMVRVFSAALSEEQQATNTEREVRAYREALASLMDRLRERIGSDAYDYLSPRVQLREGNPRTAIPALAGDLEADLVVMGTLSRSGIPGLLIGNTAEVILNNVACSVLAVKPRGFEAPVPPAARSGE